MAKNHLKVLENTKIANNIEKVEKKSSGGAGAAKFQQIIVEEVTNPKVVEP